MKYSRVTVGSIHAAEVRTEYGSSFIMLYTLLPLQGDAGFDNWQFYGKESLNLVLLESQIIIKTSRMRM